MEAPLDTALLEQLLPLYPQADFEKLFDLQTRDIPRGRSFLLKMELKRLWTRSIRVIDMRFQGYPCEEVTFQGITHFLGQQDRQLFKSALERFQNQYTLGVYEWFMQHREQATPEKLAKAYQNSRLKIPLIKLNQQAAGQEERLYVVSEIKLYLQPDAKPVAARISNLSERGLNIALLEPCAYELGSVCEIEFTELQKEYNSGILQRRWQYVIRDEENNQSGTHLRLSVEMTESPLTFFMSQFIEHNRGRYRVSIDYLFSATEAKGFEQIYLPRMSGIPLYFSAGAQPQLKFALKTENNSAWLDEWKNAKNEECLAQLFPEERLRKWFAQADLVEDTDQPLEVLLYSFTHTQNQQLYFYSATPEELAEQSLTWQFFLTGRKRPSWRLYRCQIKKLQHSPEQSIAECPAALQKDFHSIEYVGLLHPIPFVYSSEDFLAQATPHPVDPNRLNCFLNLRKTAPATIATLRYPALRAEPRYVLKTPVEVHVSQPEGPDLVLDGWTRDCSVHGLQIELDSFFAGDPKQAVKLFFPVLSKNFPHKKLSSLWYEVVQFNHTRTILHLKRNPNIHPLTSHDFFQWLIDDQLQKLRQTREQQQYPHLVQELRRLLVQSMPLYVLFIDRRYASQLGTLGISRTGSLDPVLLTDDRKQADCIGLLKGDVLKTTVVVPLLRTQRSDRPESVELYIAAQIDKIHNEIRLSSDFSTQKERIQFVHEARQKGEFFSVMLEVSKTGRPDMEFLAEELNYMTKYARHKAKQLEESLWRVIGVCDLIDTTSVTEYRLFGRRLPNDL